jgi:membrane-bound transcription factor site-1 protease
MLNPGSLKQALVEGAVRLPDINIYEQGNGRINLPASQKVLAAYSPRASVIPPAIDFTDCPYMWPYCTQPLYAFGLPVAFNATIVNGMAVTAQLVDPPVFKATDEGGRLLHVTFKHSEIIWPWSGYLAVFVEVSVRASRTQGFVAGGGGDRPCPRVLAAVTFLRDRQVPGLPMTYMLTTSCLCCVTLGVGRR